MSYTQKYFIVSFEQFVLYRALRTLKFITDL